MRYFSLIILLFLTIQSGFTQIRNKYSISFDNAEHHEANVTATFTSLQSGTVSLKMSRTSPGRYALHEFAKNVYNVKITDSKGKNVTVTRPNLHQWDVTGHDGTIHVYYTLFADRGDGTYSQIDETHALINNPATFMYVSSLKERPIEVLYVTREDLGWKIATQLTPQGSNSFLAPNLHFFMDSPALLSNHVVKEYKVGSGDKEYLIKMALQHNGTDQEANVFFDQVKKIVEEEKKVFGDYPSFENNEYTFLACFMPQVSRDGMEHRNSTVITNPKSIANGGMKDNISTFAHEFFHAWNVERIRPLALEPFDFDKANLCDELWFAEGVTSYYTNLSLCRSGIISQEEYITRLTKTYNEVWNSPALKYYNPREMSRKAPFVDAATTVDPVHRGNTYVSYYSYGNMLGLAMDLALRDEKNDLNLDDFMKLFWTKYGKTEIPYTTDNLFITLREYAGTSFADKFFSKYINGSEVPDFKKLLGSVAIYLKSEKDPYIGAEIEFTKNGLARISEYTKQGTPAYEAGLEKEDIIISIGNKSFSDLEQYHEVVNKNKSSKKVILKFKRNGKDRSTYVKIGEDPKVILTEYSKPNEKALQRRKDWLGGE
ncbi:putative metalloprotease with PDZ domain [Aquimarina sp. MAR_2010_214]|uniref:M61 family metallopeptidase n=1 Tax=Aquimarina sp. MAR_2010_214 TaxID=1250026 RepID=UPI000C7093B1|nr:PDZ domain-containing protein [Aquimarina sp. MAR_2010_214]PKV50730.1 putative metalloprotease with PDZ domain [Aquimarina sp. MAR_2010_214]